jgi:hypothetical protein
MAPARHLSKIELGREILRGAGRHFELPGKLGLTTRSASAGRLEFERPADQSPVELMAGEQPSVMRFHPPLRAHRENRQILGNLRIQDGRNL